MRNQSGLTSDTMVRTDSKIICRPRVAMTEANTRIPCTKFTSFTYLYSTSKLYFLKTETTNTHISMAMHLQKMHTEMHKNKHEHNNAYT